MKLRVSRHEIKEGALRVILMHLLSFSLLLYVEIIVVYYWFLAMLSHCFPGLCGITVCLTHTDGLTSEVYNPHNVILFKFADDVDDAYR